jgi:hypothetical protein
MLYFKERVVRFIYPFLALALSGCSSVETYNNARSFPEYENNGSYSIKVRTQDQSLSQYTYEVAFLKFSQILDISEKEDAKGSIEITFSSKGQSAFVGSSSSSTMTNAYGSAWYTGANHANLSGSAYSTTTGTTSGSTFDWQNSNMLITIKDRNGKRLWSADYTYKGGWELSGWAVNTSADAAKLCVDRLVRKFKSENTI